MSTDVAQVAAVSDVNDVPVTASDDVLLIDLSSLAHPIWHMSSAEPDPNHTSQQIVARVRALASGHPHVAICCDSGRSFRKDIADSYKANRPPAEAMLHHQIDLAREQLAADGFPIWAVKGYEADDLIASAVEWLITAFDPPKPALIVSADKDLLQLVGLCGARQMNARDGSIFDAEAVAAKFGVKPAQIRDYLTLVGDASDNIKGAPGIGPKKAADLLARFQTIEGIYDALEHRGTLFTPALATSLREFLPNLVTTRELVTLRRDVALPLEELFAERVAKEAAEFVPFEPEEDVNELPAPTVERTDQGAVGRVEAAEVKVSDLRGNGASASEAPSASPLNTPVAEPEIVTLALAPRGYERELDPQSMKDARVLAKDMHDSRMFSAYGTPQAVLSTVMLGRELGLPAMASLRSIHIVEGRHTLSAQLMVALVLKSGFAEYFEPVEFDATHAIFVTKRKGARAEVTMEHTIDMAKTAGLVKPNSNWVKVPTDMLCARAQSRLARLVYPDVVGGLYTPDEIAEAQAGVK